MLNIKMMIMKKLIIASSFLVASAMTASAQVDTSSTATNRDRESAQYSQDKTYDDKDNKYQDKERIATTELPALIQEQLRSSDFTSWTVEEAYRKEKEGKTMYAVELSNGSETKWVKFDAQGNKLKEKDKDSHKSEYKDKDKDKAEYRDKDTDHTGSN